MDEIKRPDKETPILKFVPGRHYYVGDEVFGSLESAQEFIRSKGGIPGDVEYTHLYREGD